MIKSYRSPAELDAMILAHTRLFGTEPRLISLNTDYVHQYANYFAGRIHILCCGKGALYAGILCILSTSKFVDDFLIAY
jgi:hypothetical protein